MGGPSHPRLHRRAQRATLGVPRPDFGLERIEFGGGLVRWKVALSDETDSIDPVHARQVNEYLAEDLQELFWKKDGRVVVDSALRANSASKVVPLRPA